tara:strand:- start:1717 stop:1827 length:111 start_codon:yes stop_codon:yes gene_type:complete
MPDELYGGITIKTEDVDERALSGSNSTTLDVLTLLG